MKRYIKADRFPDYEKIRGAQAFLNTVDSDKIRLVEECRNKLLSTYSDPRYLDEDSEYAIGPVQSEILRDYKCIAAEEWEDCTVEKANQLFDDILSAIDDINVDEASAWT